MSNSKKTAEKIALGVLTTGILSGALPTEAGKEIPEKGKLKETKAKTEIQAEKLEKVVKAAAFGGGAATIPLSEIGVLKKIEQIKEKVITEPTETEEMKKAKEAIGGAPQEKKAKLFLSFEDFSNKIKKIIEKITEGETIIKDYSLKKIDNKIKLNLKLNVKGFKIGLTGNIVNKDEGIDIEQAEIDAPFLIRGLAKKTFLEYLPRLSQIFAKNITEESKQEVKRLQLDESGNLIVDFKLDS